VLADALEDAGLGRGDVAVARLRERGEDAVLQGAVRDVEQQPDVELVRHDSP
jgi:hypothetical protein